MVAQGSRRCTFSIDTVDESKNRSKGAQVHGNLQTNDEMVAQGSRRCTFSIDTVDESKNRSKGAQVHGNLQTNTFSTKKVLRISTPVTSWKVDFFSDTGRVQG